ncbi:MULTISPECIES: putative bifunctional diguanylate cyclase/phosphodiesterase [Roseateles]|nr:MULTISPECIES: bifunctional diguanylate cyclase/phosphodiesterase [Roseateles]
MRAIETQTPGAPAAEPAAPADLPLQMSLQMPLRLLLRFADPAFEQRFVQHYVAFYLRYAQASLLLGALLVSGDWLIDQLAHGGGAANFLRLSLAVPVLLLGLACSFLPQSRRHWQGAMASFIVVVALCLFFILVRIDAEGGAGLKTWVGVLNFTFLEFYCFVILGVQFRHALASGLLILAAFLYALFAHAGLLAGEAGYWTYHVLTVFILAAGIGWWREFVLRKEFLARAALDDALRAAEQRAMRLAHYDEVTGLPNRRLLAELSAPALAQAGAGGPACALLHLEIDRFGGMHDLYGHGQSDLMLAGIAQRLRTCLRGQVPGLDWGLLPGSLSASLAAEPDLVLARLGDQAFAVFITGLEGQDRASGLAQRLLAAVAEPVPVDGQQILLTASIGIAMCPGDAQDLLNLTRCAEQTAHVAAEAGGAQHKFFDEALNARAKDRVLLEAELRQALLSGQLRLHYQPKVDACNARLVGAEALLRWQHPQRGLIAPGLFIPLAEDSGLIAPLTDWVLHAACQSLRRWADLGLAMLPLSVNLPASSLADAGLPEQLSALVQHYGLQPAWLMLELTETMLMREMATAVAVLDRLRALGFGLSLDDFGTGYSSLSHLKRLPMSELKIDRAFITEVARGGRDAALASAIITLGRELGLQVVAEGVETQEQSEFLIGRGCRLQQGYWFARPLPPEAFEAMLRAGTTRV